MDEKYNQLIMVVKREKLFCGDQFQGFLFAENTDFKKRVLENFQYLKRKDVETDSSYKQPIGYVVLVNERNKKVFTYQRAEKEKDATERRLHGKWSFGIGGHIDKIDEGKGDPIEESVAREIKEEIDVKVKEIRLVGYINDESDSVGEVHFGLLYLAKTEEDIVPKGREIKRGQMVAIDKIEKMGNNCDIELWSKIIFPFLKKIL